MKGGRAKEFKVERKQTLVNENARWYRFYIWMYPDFWTQKITFCRLFWGFTLMMPFAIFANCTMIFTITLGKGTWWGFLRIYDATNWIWDHLLEAPYTKWRAYREPIIEARNRQRDRERRQAHERERQLQLAREERDDEWRRELELQKQIEWDVTYGERMERRKWEDYEKAWIENARIDREAEERRKRAALLAAEEAKRARRRERWERMFRMAEGAGSAFVTVCQRAWPVAKIVFYAFGGVLVLGAVVLLALILFFAAKILLAVIKGAAIGLAATGGGLWWLVVTCGAWVINNIGYIGGSILAAALIIGLCYAVVRSVVTVVRAERTAEIAAFFIDSLFQILYYTIVKPLRVIGFPVKWGARITARGAKKAGSKVGDGAVKAADTGIGFISAMAMGVKSIKYKTCPIITVVDDEGNVIDEKTRRPKPLPGGFDLP